VKIGDMMYKKKTRKLPLTQKPWKAIKQVTIECVFISIINQRGLY